MFDTELQVRGAYLPEVLPCAYVATLGRICEIEMVPLSIHQFLILEKV